MRAIYRSKYGMYDTNSNGYIDDKDTFVSGYTIIYVAVNKEIDKHIIVSAGADNLFNYTNKKYISNMPGRIVYGKLIINF